jgi:hypothetical protein
MNFVEQLSAVALLIDFFLGVTFGIVGSAAHGSRREDRDYTMFRAAPVPISARVIRDDSDPPRWPGRRG